MKRIIPLILTVSLLLASCGALNPAPANPTPSDEQLATRVAQILTAMPSPTAAAVEATQAPATVEPTTVPPTAEPSATTVPTEAPTATTAPSQAATAVPTTAPTAALTSATPTAVATFDPNAQAGGGGPTDTPVPQSQQGGGGPGVLPAGTQAAPSPTAPPTLAAPSVPSGPLAANDPRLRLGNPSFTDTMDSANNWPSGVDPAGFTSVVFANSQMQLTGLKTRSGWRLSRYGTESRDFYIEIRVTPTTCTGNDRYGLYFRVPDKLHPDQGYWYGFTCDGRFALQKWDAETGAEGTVTNLIYWKTSPAIKAGPAVTHRMGVMAIGQNIWLYADGQLVGQSSDNTWLQGAFGVFVGARETQNFTILVDQLDVWNNPVAP